MNDTHRVRGRQRGQHLQHHEHGVRRVEPRRMAHGMGERRTIHEFHCQERIAVVKRKVIDGDDVGMQAPPGRARLSPEAVDVVLTLGSVQQVGADELDRDNAVDLRVMGAIDDAHRSPA